VVQPQQPATEKYSRESVDSSLSNVRMKNSLSEKRGSNVKLIEKLVSSIASNEVNSAALASSAS
jgi:hypothetical protein